MEKISASEAAGSAWVSNMDLEKKTVLIIEDGDEYLASLSRFVPGPVYAQVHTGAQAIEYLNTNDVNIIYLDMRFDRIPEAELMGDLQTVIRDMNGDPVKAMRFLKNNQGLYILNALRQNGLDNRPIILGYDFTREAKRFEHLKHIYTTLTWVSDAVTHGQIKELFNTL